MERVFGTLQKRLPQEPRVARIKTVAGANRFLRERFVPDYNARSLRCDNHNHKLRVFITLAAVVSRNQDLTRFLLLSWRLPIRTFRSFP
jgi:hypothetical protein